MFISSLHALNRTDRRVFWPNENNGIQRLIVCISLSSFSLRSRWIHRLRRCVKWHTDQFTYKAAAAPAAQYKVFTHIYAGIHLVVFIWGDSKQLRSFRWILCKHLDRSLSWYNKLVIIFGAATKHWRDWDIRRNNHRQSKNIQNCSNKYNSKNPRKPKIFEKLKKFDVKSWRKIKKSEEFQRKSNWTASDDWNQPNFFYKESWSKILRLHQINLLRIDPILFSNSLFKNKCYQKCRQHSEKWPCY